VCDETAARDLETVIEILLGYVREFLLDEIFCLNNLFIVLLDEIAVSQGIFQSHLKMILVVILVVRVKGDLFHIQAHTLQISLTMLRLIDYHLFEGTSIFEHLIGSVNLDK
jgi:hypothetical protein